MPVRTVKKNPIYTMKNLTVSIQYTIEPSKTLVYTVVVLLLLGLAYFIYNFYVCHKKKIDYGIESEDDHHYGIEIQQRKDNLWK